MAKEKSVIKILKDSIKSYTKNLNLSLPFLFLILITLASTQIFSLLTGGSQDLDPNASPFVLFIAAVFTIIILYSYSYLISGAIGMGLEIGNKKKSALQTIIKTGRKFWLRTLGVTTIFLAATTIPFFILIVIASPLVENSSILTQSITGFLIILIVLLILSFFVLAPYFIIKKNLKVIAGVKNSFAFAKKNYWNVFSILVIFTIAGILIGLIPVVEQIGNVITLLVLAPIQTLAFIFYMLSKEK